MEDARLTGQRTAGDTLPEGIGISVQIGRTFIGRGDGAALERLYRRAALYNLLGHAVLAVAALSLSALAAAALLLAPSDRAGLVPWLAAPAAIAALGLGGFALFRISARPDSIVLTGATGDHDPGAS